MDINIDERVKTAQDLFRQGFNCTQAVVLAFQDVLGVDKTVLERLAMGLGGGVGRMREVCGAVSAMAVIAGTLSPIEGKPIRQQKSETYAVVQELAEEFRKENGSVVCRELMGLRSTEHISPTATERTEEFYHTRPCERLVGCSARIVAKRLKELEESRQ